MAPRRSHRLEPPAAQECASRWAALLRGGDAADAPAGEVWCEGARLHLNPHSAHYDTLQASRYLRFALQFTPQYGDSFIEWLRLCLLVAAGFGTHNDDEADDDDEYC